MSRTISNKERIDEVSSLSSDTLMPFEIDTYKVACSLNLATVSVSQIIDYNDSVVLDQEYDAVLNNLNLQNIVHDQPLLDVFAKILDVVTFFRIDERERMMVEREYQHRLKSAIWSAVPNFGLLVAGGNWITMAVSLASQVGIGYMNYRKEKSNLTLERDKEMWRLERSAIEQLNGLRRELFSAAWKLSDKYGFPDHWRLTEHQISEYNNILMDSDPYRRFQRLDFIKDNYEAYPPFWYNFAHTAKEIYDQSDRIWGDEAQDSGQIEEMKNKYKGLALKYYNNFVEWNGHKNPDLLREDVIYASNQMEHIALLDFERDSKRVADLLDSAQKHAGNNLDVLQMLTLVRLRRNEDEDKRIAEKNLCHLVNSGYNVELNAKALSRIYAERKDKESYRLLSCAMNESGHYSCMTPYELPPVDDLSDKKTEIINKIERFTNRLSVEMSRNFFKAVLGPNGTSGIGESNIDDMSTDQLRKCALEIGRKEGWDVNEFYNAYLESLYNMCLNMEDGLLEGHINEIRSEIGEKHLKNLLGLCYDSENDSKKYENAVWNFFRRNASKVNIDTLFEKVDFKSNNSELNPLKSVYDAMKKILSDIDKIEGISENSIITENPLMKFDDGIDTLINRFGYNDMQDIVPAEYVKQAQYTYFNLGNLRNVENKLLQKLKEQGDHLSKGNGIIYPGSEEMKRIHQWTSNIKGNEHPIAACKYGKKSYLLFYRNALSRVERQPLGQIDLWACSYDEITVEKKPDSLTISGMKKVKNIIDYMLMIAPTFIETPLAVGVWGAYRALSQYPLTIKSRNEFIDDKELYSVLKDLKKE